MGNIYNDDPSFARSEKSREPSVSVNEIPAALADLHKQLDSLVEQTAYLVNRIDPITSPRQNDIAEPDAAPARTVLGRAVMDATEKVLRLRALVGTTAELVQL